MMNWSTADALKVYNLPYWGGGFFHLDEQGRVVVAPDKRRPEHRVALVEIVDMLRQQGLATPLLLRFPDIIKSRVDGLFNAFSQAIENYGYEGEYQCVYPIKVNQQNQRNYADK